MVRTPPPLARHSTSSGMTVLCRLHKANGYERATGATHCPRLRHGRRGTCRKRIAKRDIVGDPGGQHGTLSAAVDRPLAAQAYGYATGDHLESLLADRVDMREADAAAGARPPVGAHEAAVGVP